MATRKTSAKVSKSNAPKYLLSKTIDDILDSKKTEGKAGAGLIVALFNQTDDQWKPRVIKGKRIEPLKNYFRADTKEIIDPATNKADPNFPTRKMVQDMWLAKYSDHYKSQLARSVVLQKKLEDARESENRGLIVDAEHALKRVIKPINAARSMFHRSATALYHLYKVLPISVTLNEHDAIIVAMSNPDDEEQAKSDGAFNASDLTTLGNKSLIKDEVITTTAQTPPPAPGTITKPPAVNATTALTVMGELEKLFTSDKFNPPVAATGKNASVTVDKQSQAEFAMTCLGDIKVADVNKSAELRETISKLAVTVMGLLRVSTVEQAVKMQGSLNVADAA
jgi:hypothetical protein